MLFGKEFQHTCFGLLGFDNPDGEELELLKKLTLVWKEIVTDAVKKGKIYLPGEYEPAENEWTPIQDTDAHAGRPLGQAYTKSLDVEFYITIKKKFVNHAAVGFSGGELAPADYQQFPVALGIGASCLDRFEAIKGKKEGYTCVEILKYQANTTYCVEMSLNIKKNTYSATVWMLDADGRPDTPYYIAKDFPFGSKITAIDTVYPVHLHDDSAYIIRDFKVVGGE